MKTYPYSFMTFVDIQQHPGNLRTHDYTSWLNGKTGIAILLHADAIVDVKK
jgi:hypothetical protein